MTTGISRSTVLSAEQIEPAVASAPASSRSSGRRRRSSESSGETSYPGQRFDNAVEIILICLLTFMPLAFGATDAWSELVVVAGTVLLSVVACLKFVFVPKARFVWSWTYVPVALFLGLVALQIVPLPIGLVKAISPETVALKTRFLAGAADPLAAAGKMTLSFYPFETAHTLRLLLCAAAVFVVMMNTLRRTSQITGVLMGVAGVAAVVSLIGLAQFLSGTDKIYWIFPMEHKNAATFANHSNLGQFLNLSIGAAVAVLALQLDSIRQDPRLTPKAMFTRLDRPDVLLAWAMMATVCVSSVMLFLSLTRGGMLGWGLAAVVTLVLLWRQRELRPWLMVLLPVIFLAGTIVTLSGIDQVWNRISTVGVLDDDNRRQLDWARWQMSGDILKQVLPKFPLFGVGMGAHETFYSSVRTVSHWAIAGHADDDYAEVLEEVGLVGAAIAALFFGGVAAAAVRNLKKGNAKRRLMTAGLTFGLVGILVCSATDFGQRVPANFTITAIFAAALLVLARQDESRGSGSRDARSLPGLALVAIAFFGVLSVGAWATLGAARSAKAETNWLQALAMDRTLRGNNWSGTNDQYTAIINATQAAAQADPQNVRHQYWLCVYRWQAMTRLRDPQTGDLIVSPTTLKVADRVVSDLHSIRWLCPTFSPICSTAGQIGYYVLKRPEAEADIRLGHTLAPFDMAAYFAVAQLDARQKKFDLAKTELAEVVNIQNQYFEAAVDLSLNELNNPDLAIASAGDSARRMYMVYNLLAQRNDPQAATAKALAIAGYEKLYADPNAPVRNVDALGDLYLLDKRLEDAIQCYRRALNLDFRGSRSTKLALTLERAGHFQEAKIESQRALRMNPDDNNARDILERVSARISD